MRMMLRFTHRLTLVYGVIVAFLFYTPLRDVILSGIMGLPPKLSSYATPGVQMILLVVIVWGYSSLSEADVHAAIAAVLPQHEWVNSR